jgi:hypothetical protein
VRTRWQDWVIALALFALGVTGIWAIWGPALSELLHPTGSTEATGTGPASHPTGAGAEAGTTDGAAPARTPPPPAGPAQGPF